MQKKSKILIVDDEPKNLKILKIRFEDDYDLLDVPSGEEALQALTTFRPAVVLLDVMMKGVDGFEVTREIRKNPALSTVKVILLSGKATIDDKLEGYSCGADDYLTKPFDGEELKAKLKNFVKLHHLEETLRGVNDSLEKQVALRSEQLISAERMAYVGRHACEIVHNLRNPISILKLQLSKVEPLLKADDSYEKMNRAIDRLLDIIKDILSATGELKNTVKSIDINQVVEQELEILKLDTVNQQKITRDVQLKSKRPLMASSSHIHQVVGNLMKNAFEAMYGQPEGKVRVTTEDFDKYLLLTIEDTGHGITPENLGSIFEPLFTTKDGQNGGPMGNGLGLPYCKKMVESYGGKIVVSSEVGKGTRFSVSFPFQNVELVDEAYSRVG